MYLYIIYHIFTDNPTKGAFMNKDFSRKLIPLLHAPNFSGVEYTPSCASTMLTAREHAYDRNYDRFLFISGTQTEGTGTNGRSFLSEEGGIYLSAIFNSPDFDPSELSVRLPVGVCLAVNRICEVPAGIKWVNDIILGGKKVAGILTKTAYMGTTHAHTIIGIGLNVNQPSIGEFDSVAGSLYTLTGKKYPLLLSTAILINSLHDALYDIPMSEAVEIYRRNSLTVGKTAVISRGGKLISCAVTDISPDGHLIAEHDGETIKIISRSEVIEFTE